MLNRRRPARRGLSWHRGRWVGGGGQEGRRRDRLMLGWHLCKCADSVRKISANAKATAEVVDIKPSSMVASNQIRPLVSRSDLRATDARKPAQRHCQAHPLPDKHSRPFKHVPRPIHTVQLSLCTLLELAAKCRQFSCHATPSTAQHNEAEFNLSLTFIKLPSHVPSGLTAGIPFSYA